MPDGCDTADHSAADRRYLTALGISVYTDTGVVGQPSQATEENGLGAVSSHLGAAAGTLIGLLALAHDWNVCPGGCRPLALPSATTDRIPDATRTTEGVLGIGARENLLYCHGDGRIIVTLSVFALQVFAVNWLFSTAIV